MGLLDDAIREHLDLKRRRGADPTEIERAEREALGPVRRGPEVTGEDVPSPAPADEVDDDYSSAESEQWEPFDEDPESRGVEEEHDELPYERPRAPQGDPLMEDEPFPGDADAPPPPHPADVSPATEPEPSRAPHAADSRPAPTGPPRDESAPQLDQETEEYELEPEREADDDVLETTPEFLQDAPEHDRLWFEQRPPRDFDFDG
jgi:hypothetical protein